jgi:hypothetical protein
MDWEKKESAVTKAAVGLKPLLRLQKSCGLEKPVSNRVQG